MIDRPIILTGVMGSGKSTVGKRLAKRLHLQFYDSDKVIEEREGLSVVDIHDFKGENYFRQQELKVVAEIVNYGPLVLATGGNSFTQQELRELIRSRALVICLYASMEVLYERIIRRNTRPEFNVDDKKAVLERMIEENKALSAEADILVESVEQDSHYVVDTIISRLKKHMNVLF